MHNNSQAFYLYSYEPGGNRIEIYSGGYLVFAPDWEPVIWNEEERGTGVYWRGALPDSFLNYATPDVESSDPKEEPIEMLPFGELTKEVIREYLEHHFERDPNDHFDVEGQ